MDQKQRRKIQKTVDHYNNLSKRYDRGYSAYLRHTHTRLLQELSLTPGDRVLDISGGTGLLAESLLDRYPGIEIVLNEPSAGMRAIAEDRLRGSERVTFTGHFAEELAFAEDSFDCVICLNSFHYFTDQDRVIGLIKHSLRTGGKFYLLDWNLEGLFHIPNSIISLFSPENINTKSMTQITRLLDKQGFEIRTKKRWWFRFWKFYLIEAVAPGIN